MLEKIIIWSIPEEDFDLWCIHCDGSGTWLEYLERQHTAVEYLRSSGFTVEITEISVSNMLEEIQKQGIENNADNRAKIAAEWKT